MKLLCQIHKDRCLGAFMSNEIAIETYQSLLDEIKIRYNKHGYEQHFL